MRIDMTGNQRYVPKSHAKLEVPYIIYMVMTMMVTTTIMMLISLMLQTMTDYHNDHAGELTTSATLNE